MTSKILEVGVIALLLDLTLVSVQVIHVHAMLMTC